MTVEVLQPGLVGTGWRTPGDCLDVPDARMLARLISSGRVKQDTKSRTAYTVFAERRAAHAGSRKIVFSCCLAGGDIVALSGAIRDFRREHPDIKVGANTSYPAIFENSGVQTSDFDSSWDVCDIGYNGFAPDFPHIVEAFRRDISRVVGVPNFTGPDKGVIYLSDAERAERQSTQPYWIVMAGGKFDVSTKWYPRYQQVIDLLPDIQWIQCGAAGHNHALLRGPLSMVGNTSLRQFIRLIWHAQGVLCPITMAMHLAGAMGVRAVVIAGGRENASLCYYPGHVRFDSLGSLPCCKEKPCWRATVHHDDGPEGDKCLDIVGGFARCMNEIDPRRIAAAIKGITHDG